MQVIHRVLSYNDGCCRSVYQVEIHEEVEELGFTDNSMRTGVYNLYKVGDLESTDSKLRTGVYK